MTKNDKELELQSQKTDEAWAKLQASLANEPVNPAWERWGTAAGSQAQYNALTEAKPEAQLLAQSEMQSDLYSLAQGAAPVSTAAELATARTGANGRDGTAPAAGQVRRRPRRSRKAKWAGAAAAVALFGAVLATPVGNTAMAAILNQFRMEEPAVVQEEDLTRVFNTISEGGTVNETLNRYGEFSTSDGTAYGTLNAKEINEKLGYRVPERLSSLNRKWDVSPSRDVSMKLNVTEINKMMKRLGADKLLPESVDGVKITMHIPETIHYSLPVDNEQKFWLTLSQSGTPNVLVDSSASLEEAVDAVIDFPLLPGEFKESLQKSRVLSGEIPMPLFANEDTRQITVDGTLMLLGSFPMDSGGYYFTANWVKDGQLFEAYGGNYASEEAFLNQIRELM
ncbi:hypothetical protein ACE6ED_12215 [Paenibacillus sp. CN-4]|uniref:hypothetical protein n=1 Tax=Paenibacillus nanchangensis TaxID=3348343 RepID=UPI00397A7930